MIVKVEYWETVGQRRRPRRDPYELETRIVSDVSRIIMEDHWIHLFTTTGCERFAEATVERIEIKPFTLS